MIRPYEETDRDEVYALAQLFARTSVYIAWAPTIDKLRLLERLVLDTGAAFVADIDGQVVGFIAVVAIEHPFTGQLYAEELAWFVHPDHRQGLVGPRLLRAIEEWTRQEGVPSLKMVAPVAESQVRDHYLASGYKELETSYVKTF
jgi:GNAT superfamily N-acetyltransferase